jgi:hypothetical protein
MLGWPLTVSAAGRAVATSQAAVRQRAAEAARQRMGRPVPLTLGIGIDQVGKGSAADCADLVAHAARSRVGQGTDSSVGRPATCGL